MARSWLFLLPRVMKALVVFTLLTLVILTVHIPSRNVLLGWVLPGPWYPISTMQLIKMHQHVAPIEVGTCRQSQCSKMFTPTTRREDIRRRSVEYYDYIDYYKKEIPENLWNFLPVLTRADKEDMLYLLDVLVEVVTQAQLTYFLVDGTLLGVVRHRGVVPWDDDIDIAMNGSEWKRVKDVLCCVQGFQLVPQNFMHWKFVSRNSSVIRGAPQMRFPFIDIFFFTEDSEYIWSLTHYNLQNMAFKKSDIFPLTTGPLEGRAYAIPRHTDHVVQTQFMSLESCRSPSMFHKYNHALHGSEVTTVPCSHLADLYTMHTTLGGDGGG